MIDATLVTFPVIADELNTGVFMFTTTREAAAACMGTDAFEPVDQDGHVNVLVTLFEYVRGDWAPCDSVDIVFAAKPAGAPIEEAGFFMGRAVVNARFNSEAAYWAMRLSRSIARIEVVHEDDAVTFTVTEGDHAPSSFRLPREASPSRSYRVTTNAYTCIDTEPYVIPFETDLPSSAGDVTELEVELGDGPLADRLRALGWPAPVTYVGWAECLTGQFHAGRPIRPEP